MAQHIHDSIRERIQADPTWASFLQGTGTTVPKDAEATLLDWMPTLTPSACDPRLTAYLQQTLTTMLPSLSVPLLDATEALARASYAHVYDQGHANRALGEALLQALLSAGILAAPWVHGIRVGQTKAMALRRIDDVLSTLARRADCTVDELEWDLPPRFGLSDDLQICREVGPLRFDLALSRKGVTATWSQDGAKLKAVPKSFRRYQDVVALGRAKNALQAALAARTQALAQDLEHDQATSRQRMMRRLCHPVWVVLLEGLVWTNGSRTFVLEQGVPTGPDGVPIDVQDEPWRIWTAPTNAPELVDWATHPVRLRQPFAQLPPLDGTDGKLAAMLLDQIHAEPHRDDLRGVLADLLQSGDDPRGELLSLQLLGGPAARQRALIKAHGDHWIGRAAPYVVPRSIQFRRGFPGTAILKPVDLPAEVPPELALVERLDIGRSQALETVLGWDLPALRELRSVPLDAVYEGSLPSMDLEAVELVARRGSIRRKVPPIGLAAAFPRLTRLDTRRMMPPTVEEAVAMGLTTLVLHGDVDWEGRVDAAMAAGLELCVFTAPPAKNGEEKGWSIHVTASGATFAHHGAVRGESPQEKLATLLQRVPPTIPVGFAEPSKKKRLEWEATAHATRT